MSVTGLCEICENRTAEHSCLQCGAVVCEKHFDQEFDVCLQCAPAGGDQPGRGPSDDSDVDTFRI